MGLCMGTDTSLGHLSVHVAGAPPDVRFMFEQQPARTFWSVVASGAIDIALVGLFVLLGRIPHHQATVVTSDPPLDQVVWLVEPGPGGGGGGSPGPLRKVDPKPMAEPVKPVDLTPPQDIPTQSLSSVDMSALGVVQGVQSGDSLGIGLTGGGGTGTGVGSGTGSGLGPGSGGGTGGGVYQPGNGVTAPVPIVIPKPAYTPEAMRARLQGTARVKCIVQPNGVCTNIEIERSLDPTFGLDQQAVKSVQQWRFKPGMRLGQPVAVQVLIDVEFALR